MCYKPDISFAPDMKLRINLFFERMMTAKIITRCRGEETPQLCLLTDFFVDGEIRDSKYKSYRVDERVRCLNTKRNVHFSERDFSDDRVCD